MAGLGTQMSANVAAAFDDAADRYDSVGPQFAGPIAARLVDLAGLRPGGRVLDVGCGSGAVLIRAARAVGPGGHVTGIDFAPRMLVRAEREAVDEGVGDRVTLRQGDAASPPLDPGTFDAVLASLVLYLLADPAAALARWRELLVPGGTLAFSRGAGPDARWSPVIAAVDAYAAGAAGFESYVHRPGQLSDTEEMLAACGYTSITRTVETVTVRYDSPQQWWEASVAEGPWVTWRHIPADRLADARAEAMTMAEDLREPDGSLLRRIQMAYLTARRPAAGDPDTGPADMA
jgi:ubiquinone/menaquinone biosynthesis C-methylase UbiE